MWIEKKPPVRPHIQDGRPLEAEGRIRKGETSLESREIELKRGDWDESPLHPSTLQTTNKKAAQTASTIEFSRITGPIFNIR